MGILNDEKVYIFTIKSRFTKKKPEGGIEGGKQLEFKLK